MKLKRIKAIFQQLFTYSRQERNGILVLCILLFILITLKFIVRKIPVSSEEDYSEMITMIEHWEAELETKSKANSLKLFDFNPNETSKEELDSLALPKRVKSNILSYTKSGGVFDKPSDIKRIYGMTDSLYTIVESYVQIPVTNKKVIPQIKNKAVETEYFYFDPNTSTQSELSRLGLNKFQIRNIFNYRSKGGVFRKAVDISKIYGMDSAMLKKLKPWVKIENKHPVFKNKSTSIKIELNSADSIDLIKLKGIGPYFANRIIKYRDYLGGFYSKNQLCEVYNLPFETFSEIEHCIWVDTTLIQKISINFSDAYELSKHPYISKEFALKITAYRNKNGAFTSCTEVIKNRLVNEDDYKRIYPYLKIN